MVQLIGKKAMNHVVSRHGETQSALRKENRGVTRRAKANLAQADSTHRITLTGYFPARIESSEGDIDHFTTLVAPNAMALEFGHEPSGVFAGTDTKAPDGQYILIRAAISGSPS